MDRRVRDAILLVERRRRRRVARLLRRMDRLDGTRPRRRTSDTRRRATTAVTVLGLLLVGVFVSTLHEGPSSSASAFPDRPDDARDAPNALRVPRTPSKEYAFVQMQDDGSGPVTYDPCVPIHLVVDSRTIVDGGMTLLEQALDEVRDTTGLMFTVDGLTDEAPPEEGTVTKDGGRGWLPVRVSWSDPAASEKLAGDVAGYAGSATVPRDDHEWFVTGSVVLDGPQLTEILKGPHGWASARSVVMHELGHLVGLDHVDASGQLMQPEGNETLTTWGDGDRAGLAALGRGECISY
ncbi:MAG: matrixin family metalloprotease [Aeromicrobium sp.]